MNLNTLRTMLAAPMAALFAILILCVVVMERPASTGIRIPMMRTRAKPLNNCSFSGFTVYLRSDGKIGGGDRDDVISRNVVLSRIREAENNIRDDSIFVIADPDVSYGEFASLITDIHSIAPADNIAVVPREAQFQPRDIHGVPWGPVWADRCVYEWPALAGQPKWPAADHGQLPSGRMSIWQALWR